MESNVQDKLKRIRKSITQQSQINQIKNDDGHMTSVAHFCFPFDLQLQVAEKALS